MNKIHYLYTVLSALFFAGTVRADYPLMNMVADNLIDKYKIDKIVAPVVNKMFECRMVP